MFENINFLKKSTRVIFPLFLISFSFLFNMTSHADIVYLTNGRDVEGETRVDEKTGNIIVTIPGAGDLILKKQEVARIEEAPISIAPERSEPKELKSLIEKSRKSLRLSVTEESEGWNVTPEQVEALAEMLRGYQESAGPIRWIFGLVIPLVGHIVFALCLFIIAKKTETPHAWMAWVPFTAPFLVFWVVDWKVRWFFLAWLITFILMFTGAAPLSLLMLPIMIIVYVYWWVRLAQVRDKSGWLGLPMSIPFIGLIPMLYVAFNDPKPEKSMDPLLKRDGPIKR